MSAIPVLEPDTVSEAGLLDRFFQGGGYPAEAVVFRPERDA
jgi:hypothetical protein